MKKYLNTILLLFFVLINSCGYAPLKSIKKTDFYIDNLKFEGDRKVSNYITNNFIIYRDPTGKTKSYDLKIISNYEKIIKNKDKNGNPKNYDLIISTQVIISSENEKDVTQSFVRNISLTAKTNKITESELEVKYKRNISDLISEDIIFFLINNT
tara:strand:+ start:1776 stop:2240 length:465 start_codon:yes stop_codon:yes gene_type:complete